MSQDRWRRLEVWQKADELAWQVYKMTRHFPKEERYGITSQIRRAALSIPTNIVEGYSRKGDRELARFFAKLGYTKQAEFYAQHAWRMGGQANRATNSK